MIGRLMGNTHKYPKTLCPLFTHTHKIAYMHTLSGDSQDWQFPFCNDLCLFPYTMTNFIWGNKGVLTPTKPQVFCSLLVVACRETIRHRGTVTGTSTTNQNLFSPVSHQKHCLAIKSERHTETEREREKSSLYMRYNKKGSSYWELKPPVVQSVHFSTRRGTHCPLCAHWIAHMKNTHPCRVTHWNTHISTKTCRGTNGQGKPYNTMDRNTLNSKNKKAKKKLITAGIPNNNNNYNYCCCWNNLACFKEVVSEIFLG